MNKLGKRILTAKASAALPTKSVVLIQIISVMDVTVIENSNFSRS